MADFFHAVSAVFLIFSMMLVGFGLGKIGWLTSSEKRFLSRFVVNVAVPMNCITGVLNNLEREDLRSAGRMLAVPLVCTLVLLAVSGVIARLLRLPRERRGVFVAMSFLPNSLFIGVPMSTQLFGEISVPYVMLYYMVCTVFTQTVLVLLVEKAGSKEAAAITPAGLLRILFTKPPVLGVLTAFACLLLGIRPPELFMSFAKYMSGTVTPLALMYCGFIVYELGLSGIRLERGLPAMLVLRLVLSPALCAGLCALLGVTGLASQVFIIEAALPVVSQVPVLAGAYGADERYAAVGFCLSMLGVFITIPVIMMLI